ncbi:polyphosphate polymerase domain-containing protein [Jiulongibacter sediminis]|uniref:VTC domain-containing protein n=1 Tax=Jiulongibacter sediminis TaxID=1605367 RepID=A0A0P7BL53_9BACT|nr:polyphosphate polymerase domain-containing protein [Jiulongibacter sediminis]KPM47995.1 hypothetical protein AFM12_12345 [Jiulongibacter sediminis]TBX24178.1 hypothetical protein TK44_12355 [Jiulongibacter sediminis]
MKQQNHLASDLEDRLMGFSSLGLAEMSRAELLDRREVKYTFEKILIPDLLKGLEQHYRILEINEKRIFKYVSEYFDTEDLHFFHQHRSGRLNRYKVRKRQYLDSGLAFFEVKFKNNHGRTMKSRIETKFPAKGEILHDENAFLQEVSPFFREILEPTVSVSYNRVTLVNKTSSERVTIDLNLQVSREGKERGFEDLVVLEVKQDKLKQTEIRKRLKKLGQRPGTISKYCLGIISSEDDVRYNRLKPTFDKLYKPFLKTLNK